MYHKGSVDIIGMLVDIYGSTDLFLNEYRALLSGVFFSFFFSFDHCCLFNCFSDLFLSEYRALLSGVCV